MKMLSGREMRQNIYKLWEKRIPAQKRLLQVWRETAPLRDSWSEKGKQVWKKLKPESRRGFFLYAFFSVVLVLAFVKMNHPEWTESHEQMVEVETTEPFLAATDSIGWMARKNDSLLQGPVVHPCFFDAKGRRVKNRIYSVPHFGNTFPDMNDVQLATAERLGVSPVKDRTQAGLRKGELVFVGANPFYSVRRLDYSIPYLVPRAARLLEHIGRTFLDSLEVKGIAWNKIIVTSLLRTEADVERLRQRNGNASDQSCHRYGTTFDISYSKFVNVEDPDGPKTRQVRDDSLKWVLSEVLRDARVQGLCYVKYEVKQGCFHITAR